MAMTMHVNIVSAENEIYSGTVTEVYAPAEAGEVGIMPRHTQMLSTLKPGVVRIVEQGGEEIAEGINSGIVYLMAFPYVVVAVASYLLYRNWRRTSSAA